LHQIRKLPYIKENNYYNERQPTEWRKTLASYSRFKELKKLNIKRTNNPINKWANELNRQFLEEVQMAKIHEEIFNTFNHKGNTNQNNDIPSYPSHQENRPQMLVRIGMEGALIHCWLAFELMQLLYGSSSKI
jgi:hypothetical protein